VQSHRAKFIPYLRGDRSKNRFAESGNDADSARTKKEGNMFKKLLGAAAVAAVAFAVVPAHAAKMGGGCSGANLEKTESTLDAMADGENKITAQKEIAAAQDAMLSGKMGVCGMHLAKAMRAEGAK
jgi:hypothetical protein